MRGIWRWKRCIIAGIAGIALAGCGGSDDEPAESSGAAPLKQQKITTYATEFSRAQAKRLAGDDRPNPAEAAGTWKLIYNETLKLIDVKASDLGGFTLLVKRQTDDALVARDQDCADGDIELGMRRTDDSLTFTRKNDRCPETVDLLVEQPWNKQDE